MSEPYDVTRPDDANRGLIRYCDRTGREWTEPNPEVVWWQGPVVCALCGCRAHVVIPIPRVLSEPVVAMECSGCGGMAVRPAGA